MDLRIALLLLGVVLVVLIFSLGRYSDVFSNLRKKLSGSPSRRPKPSHDSNRWAHDAENAPALGSAELDENFVHDQFRDPLFNFDQDEPGGGTQPYSDPGLINDEANNQSEPEPSSPVSNTKAIDADAGQHEQPLASLLSEEERAARKPAGPFTSLRQIDYWIKLSPASPISQAKIIENLSHWDKINFPIQLHALTHNEPHWVSLLDIKADVAIADVVASFQLLEHGNATTISDLNTFVERVSILGQAIDAEKLMMATPEQALDQSLKLARFFTESHEPLEVSICAPKGQAFLGKLVETSAKQQGLDYMKREYVRQKRMASHSVVLYRVRNEDAKGFDEDMSSDAQIKCVKFTMSPALSRTPGRDAKEMLDAVKAFASRVRGEIRIPGETEYRPELLLKLRNRVSKLEKDTSAAGLEPGGPEICRIFS